MNYGFAPFYQSSWIYSLFRFYPLPVLEVAIRQVLVQLKVEELGAPVLEHRAIKM
jgi:hypothetical protein